MSEDFDVPGL